MANEYGNYDTWNPLQVSDAAFTLSNGNKTVVVANDSSVRGGIAFGPTGKYYFEITCVADNTYGTVGISPMSDSGNLLGGGRSSLSGFFGMDWQDSTGLMRQNNVTAFTGSGWTAGDILGWYVDFDNDLVFVSKNGTLENSATQSEVQAGTATNAIWDGGLAAHGKFLTFCGSNGGTNMTFTLNTGQSAFNTALYSGYTGISTANLPEPAIINPDDHFHSVVVDHDGTSTASTCTFNLDTYEWLAWIKNIDGASEGWYIINSLNGANKYHTWESATQTTDANVMTVSGTTFTLGSTLGDKSYLVEFHKAGLSSAKAANEEGATNTIATTVNLVSGFGMSEFTGTGSNTTVGHGMNIAPALTIPNNNTIADGHYVLHTGTGDPDLRLNIGTNQAAADDSANFNGSYPSATLISLGSADRTNKSGSNIVLYYWHDVANYSSFGTYEGNAAADGVFINTAMYGNKNFVKNIDGTYSWHSVSTTEQGYNTASNPSLQFDNDGVGGGAAYDVVSNGLKMRTSNANYNSAETFIYGSWGGRPLTDGAINQGRAGGAVLPYDQAYGGNTIKRVGNFWVHTFTSSGVFTPHKAMNVEYLIQAGGGGGGTQHGGGGGAGGSLTATGHAVTKQAYSVTVGAGGAGAPSASSSAGANGTNGSNSVFDSTTGTGGGGGASYRSSANMIGSNGGCGGGGGNSDGANTVTGGTGSQGFNGGLGANNGVSGNQGAGGGGMGAIGANAASAEGGDGGAGLANSITGLSVTYGGGGGGGTNPGTAGSGGTGGGGNGASGSSGGSAGTANTGGGGGAAGANGQVGGAGGSGIVIIKYAIG